MIFLRRIKVVLAMSAMVLGLAAVSVAAQGSSAPVKIKAVQNTPAAQMFRSMNVVGNLYLESPKVVTSTVTVKDPSFADTSAWFVRVDCEQPFKQASDNFVAEKALNAKGKSTFKVNIARDLTSDFEGDYTCNVEIESSIRVSGKKALAEDPDTLPKFHEAKKITLVSKAK